MTDIVQTRSLSDIRREVEATASSLFSGSGIDFDAANTRTVENLLLNIAAAEIYATDRVINRAFRAFFPATTFGAFADTIGQQLNLPRTGAQLANGEVTFSGDDNTSIPSGTIIRSDSGQEFSTTSTVSIPSGGDGTVSVSVSASVPGIEGNIEPEDSISLVSSLVGITGVSHTEAFAGGTDLESDEDYKRRILERTRQKSSGGNRNDWRIWANELPNVRATRVRDIPGTGQVIIYFLVHAQHRSTGVPTAGDLADYNELLESRRPLTTRLSVLPVRRVDVDVHISAITPDSSVIKTLVSERVAGFFGSTTQIGGMFSKSRFAADIGDVAGITDIQLSTPSGNIDLGEDGIPSQGTLTGL